MHQIRRGDSHVKLDLPRMTKTHFLRILARAVMVGASTMSYLIVYSKTKIRSVFF